jgi:hypothetical protein
MSAKPDDIDITAGGVLPNYFFVDCKNCAFSAGNFLSKAEADRESRELHGRCPECGGDVQVEKRVAQIHSVSDTVYMRITF